MSNKVDQEQLNDINELLEEGEVLNELPTIPTIVNLEPNGPVGTTTVDAAEAKKQAAAEKKAAADAKKAEAKAKKEAEAEAKKAAKQAELDKKAAEKAAKEAEKEVKKTEPKVKQPVQNGITKPKDGTLCNRIWVLCNELSEKKGSVVTKKELSEVAEAEGLYSITIGVQYYKWKKFYGLVAIKA